MRLNLSPIILFFLSMGRARLWELGWKQSKRRWTNTNIAKEEMLLCKVYFKIDFTEWKLLVVT